MGGEVTVDSLSIGIGSRAIQRSNAAEVLELYFMKRSVIMPKV